RMLTSAAELHVHGVPVDWTTAVDGGRLVDLPTYPFQRQHFWLKPTGLRDLLDDADAVAAALDAEPDAELRRLVGELAAWRRDTQPPRYRVEWHPVDPAPRQTGPWLAVAPPGIDPAALLGPGTTCLTAEPGIDRDTLAARLRAAGPHPHVVSFLPDAAATLTLVHALGEDTRLWCVTTGAVSTGDDDPVRHPEQAQIWGLGRVIALEQPSRWGGLVDLPGPDADGLRAALAGDEDQVAVRGTRLFARRIGHHSATRARQPWTPPAGAVLLTGGTGALGAHVARWLAGQGADHLVLLGRTAADTAGPLADELGALGAKVSVVSCDAADRAAVAGVLDALDAEGTPVRAVFHLAGLMDRTDIADLTPARLTEVLRAKATAAQVLHELTRDRDLTAFVLFSSIAGLWGSGGNGAYAAANAHLDALAEHRRAHGLPATSVVWGPWAGEGMMARDGFGDLVHRHGIRRLEPRRALAALRGALDRGDVTVAVADVDWPRFHTAFTATRPSRLFDPLRPARDTEPAAPPATLSDRLRDVDPARRREYVTGLVSAEVAAVLGHTADARIDTRRALRDLGFDSVNAVDLRNRLRAVTGLDLPVTLAFEHPSLDALAGFLLSRAQPEPAADADTMSLDDLVRSVLEGQRE
ncbi:beta-ketoacyl reductase, partial [Amycolatopsis suaedae]